MSEGIDWASLRSTADKATKPLPDGDYKVQCTKAELVTATTGSLMVKVNLTVTEGEWANRIIFNNFVFSPEKPFALKMWFDNLGAFGLNDQFFAQGPSLEQVAGAILERYAIVTLKQREWPEGSGTMRNECADFKTAGGVSAMMAPAVSNIPSPAAPAAASGAVPPVPKVAAGSSTPPTPNF